jgi:2-keto-4-pentenoate hydratase/2-oxohepta-3-ene-1,7-dioic acid hydratase in catechol pathway
LRLVTYEAGGRRAVGARVNGAILETGFATMAELIAAGEEGLERAREAVAREHAVEVDHICAPLPEPRQVLFHSVNFKSLADETPGCPIPERSTWFSKLPSSIVGPDEAIRKPYPDTHLDWEVELAVVIGRPASRLRTDDALSHVFGYTVVNDISARDIQLNRGDITLGKGSDTFCPMGPELVTSDEIPDPSALTISAYLNGEQVQGESLANQLFSVPANLVALTELVSLAPGDIVTTGSPAGIGMNQQPPRWLAPGDEIAVEADGIGRMSNPVIAGW